jgi:hypothetical protein
MAYRLEECMRFREFESTRKSGSLESKGNFLVFDYDIKSKRRKLRKSAIEEIETIPTSSDRYWFYMIFLSVVAGFLAVNPINPAVASLDLTLASYILSTFLFILSGYNGIVSYYYSKYSHIVKITTVSGSTVKLFTNDADDKLFN